LKRRKKAEKEPKNFFNWAVLVSAPQTKLEKVFAPLFSKSGHFLF
jgi:hypothetical protein